MAEIFKSVTISDEVVSLKPKEAMTAIKKYEALPEKADDLSDELTQHIKEEAYQLGFKEGLVEGAAKEKADTAEQLKLLNDLILCIPTAISDNRLQLSSEIADIVLIITQQFFINQQHSKDEIAKQINQILAQLNDKQNIELTLHPRDVVLLQNGLLNLDLKQCKNLRITPDETLRLGGCLIRSEHGVFDAGIERQIDSLKQALLQIKQGDPHE